MLEKEENAFLEIQAIAHERRYKQFYKSVCLKIHVIHSNPPFRYIYHLKMNIPVGLIRKSITGIYQMVRIRSMKTSTAAKTQV